MAKQHQHLTPPGPCSMMTTKDSLARKSSDTSSSESTVPDEYGCGSFIINFLHFRSRAVDAVVDDAAIKDADAEMMEADMMDMALQDAGTREENDADNRQKPSSPSETRSTCYPSPSPTDIQSKKRQVTTTPTLPHRSVDILDIFNENQSIDLSMPKLSRSPPETLPQPHLISTTNDDEEGTPSLSLNSMSINHAQNEAMMSHIPRIHLKMRNSSQSTVHRVTDIDQGRLPATLLCFKQGKL